MDGDVRGRQGPAAGRADVMRGLGVSPGRASGPVVRFGAAEVDAPERCPVTDRAVEAERLMKAIEEVAADLEQRAEAAERAAEAGSTADATAAEILEATAMMAADPGLAKSSRALVLDEGASAAWALWTAAGRFRDLLAASNTYLAARVTDLDDVRDRIIATIEGRAVGHSAGGTTPAVLVARDLAPVDTAGLDATTVLAIVCERGGPTSHTAILAGALGIPAVVACADAVDLADGDVVTVDGDTGEVSFGEAPARRSGHAPGRPVPSDGGRLADGTKIALLANVGDASGLTSALRFGAQGVGLLRTELLFLGRRDRPTVEQQRDLYAELFGLAEGRRVVVRTLDAGADKPLPFLGLPDEENPALGMRGIRVADTDPQLLTEQLEAIALAAEDTGLVPWVMAPMISTADEAHRFAELVHEHGLGVPGAMIEVPAAALRARGLLDEVDFVSIGTNDLTQYTMAADRNDGRLAALNDPWQPAVLDLIARVAEAGRAVGKPVGVCGEAAGDPLLAAVLAGLGVTSLSMTPSKLEAVAECLATVDTTRAQRLADAVRAAPSAAEARAVAQRELAR